MTWRVYSVCWKDNPHLDAGEFPVVWLEPGQDIFEAVLQIPDLTAGLWLLDSRYSLLERELFFRPGSFSVHLSVFRVAYASNDIQDTSLGSTVYKDRSKEYAGVYWVPYEHAIEMRENPEMRNSKRHVESTQIREVSSMTLSRRRYPFPIVVLASKYDASDAERYVADMLQSTYADFAPHVATARTDYGIRDAHEYVLSQYETPVLLVDADFVPNGSPHLMLDPRRDYREQYINLWYVRNPLNRNLCYGHGSPKLMWKKHVDFSRSGEDMTTSVGRIHVNPVCVGTHGFDKTPQSTYLATRRELHKLKNAEQTPEVLDRIALWESGSHVNPDVYAAYRSALKATTVQDINNFDVLINEAKEIT